MSDCGYKIGAETFLERQITEKDIVEFARVTGDFNPLHVNKELAEKSIFKEQIAHGFLVGSTISTVLGTRLPGPGTIYLEQNLRFLKPVKIGDTVRTEVKITEIIDEKKGIIRLSTNVYNQDKDIVIEGYAVVRQGNVEL